MRSSIEKATAKGVIWRYAEEISTSVVTFAVSVVLARLMLPEDYTAVSLAMIFIGFAGSLVNFGLSAALVQKGDADGEDYAALFTFAFVASLILYAVIFLAAPVFSNFYQQKELTAVIRILGLLLIVSSVKSVYSTALLAQMNFKKLFFSSLFGTLCSAAVGILLATRGCGVWALVAQQLTDAVIDTVMMCFTAHLPGRLHFSVSRLKQLFHFSSRIAAANLIARIHNTLVPLIISMRFSALDLTFYSKARTYSGYLTDFIETPLSAVMFPALSKIKEDSKAMLALLRKFYRALYFFSFPALLGLYVVAEDLVLLLLTEKWASIIPYVHIFIISLLPNKNIQGIIAIGRSDLHMKAQLAFRILAITFLLLALLISDSPLGIAWSYLPAYASYYLMQVYLESKYLGYRVAQQLRDMLPSFFVSLVMALAVYGIGQIEAIAVLYVGIRLLIQIASGALIYFGLSKGLQKLVPVSE